MDCLTRSAGSEKSGLRVKSPGKTSALLTTTPVLAPRIAASACLAPETTRSPPSIRSASPARDPDGVDVLGAPRNSNVAEHRAALLREPRHVDGAAAPALEMGGHGEDRADGDDAGPADAGDEDGVRPLADLAPNRLGQLRAPRPPRRAPPWPRARDGDERRTEALGAGIVLVAARLVDPALAPEFRLQRLHRDAIGLDAAIAAALADALVDEDALVGVGILAALAPSALFGGAGLIVDQHRRAFDSR